MTIDSTLSLSGRSVIVTGGGQGIGAATARFLANEGARVLIGDLDLELAEAVAAEITREGGNAAAMRVDVSSWDDCVALVDRAVELYGRLDGLFNNAGVSPLGSPFEDADGSDARLIFGVNVIGSYNAGVNAMKAMARTGGGAIVNVTSGVQAGVADAAAYAASKGATAAMTYAWALDGKAHGIRVNALSPVATTRMTKLSRDLMLSRGEIVGEPEYVAPEDNAPAVAYMLSPLSGDLTGQILRTYGDTLQLIAHPAVMSEARRDRWTVQDVHEVVSTQFAGNLPPLGLTAMEVRYVEPSKTFAVPGTVDPAR